MEENGSFNDAIIKAFDEKKAWYDSVQLPKIQDNYRLHLVCVNNIIEALVKKSLVNPDPYKKDKKVSSISCPSDANFNDNERATQLGIRLSDYQSTLDFICNYFKFTVEQVTIDKIRKLEEFNGFFGWMNLSPNSARINTRSLAACVMEAKNGAQPLQAAMLNDSLNKTKEALSFIETALKELMDFQKEAYKVDVRRLILKNGAFDKSKMESAPTFLAEIKRLFPSCMPKRTFSSDLISEIIDEEISPKKAVLQEKVLGKFKITDSTKKEQKKASVSAHEILMETVRVLGTSSQQYSVILEKLVNNNTIIQNGKKNFKDQLLKFIRRVFGLQEPEIEYNIVVMDPATNQSHKEKLNYTEFVANLSKRTKYYSSISSTQSLNYNKVNAQPDDKLLEFLNKQITENSRLMQVLTALDNYFKSVISGSEKLKGIKPELSFLKSILIKVNQFRAEYVSLLEEQEQMRKLGISDD
ncbi:MAG: hypothetical protein ILP07_02515 [Treponema sp.]|nr:hypothetical protein [Treponema sp.]